jgi:hypothetical protein
VRGTQAETPVPLAHVDPAMIYLLGVSEHTPAQVADDLLTVVAQNRAAENLLGILQRRFAA